MRLCCTIVSAGSAIIASANSTSSLPVAYYEAGPHGKYVGEALPLTWTWVNLPTQELRPVIQATESQANS